MQHREITAAKESYRTLLESLYFPDIYARHEAIEEAHKQSFGWIFEKPGNEVRSWHSFIDWLENGHGTYWISGKAGSGKSTLMSLICQDSRTEAALRIWSGTNNIFMPKFFFWSPGTQLQKSLTGLLRSIIYQILERFPELSTVLEKIIAQHGFQQLPTWTENRLRDTLQHLLSKGHESYHLCIFVDGLDEFEGNQATLLTLIRNLGKSTRIKFCLSSRPHILFRDELSTSAMLRLQDLTEPDIRRYVSDELEQAYLSASRVPYSSFKPCDTINTIVRKAEGVFLWVKLAVRDQVKGIGNGDNPEQLKERLDLLPSEIEELYCHMLQKIDCHYRKEVAQYLQLARYEGCVSLFDFALAVHKRIDDIILFSPDISISDIRNDCSLRGERITATCEGFLEVREFKLPKDGHDLKFLVKYATKEAYGTSKFFIGSSELRKTPLEQRDDLLKTKFYEVCARVNFLHRTAYDFFQNNRQGKLFLETNTSNSQNHILLFIKTIIASLTVFPIPTDDSQIRTHIKRIMLNFLWVDRYTDIAYPALVDLFNRSMTMLLQRSQSQPSNEHWCRAWGLRGWFGTQPQNHPVDLLGFSAWFGLFQYVSHTIHSQLGRLNSDTANYILSCAVCGSESLRGYTTLERLNYVCALLKQGADPNLENGERTIWRSFLGRLHDWFYGANGCERYRCDQQLWDIGWMNSVQAFIERGANTNEETCFNVLQRLNPVEVAHPLSSTRLKLAAYSIKINFSAVSVLEQCFANSSGFAQIEEACIASGASMHSECAGISFQIQDGRGECFWLDSKLPKQHLSQFLDLWGERVEAGRRGILEEGYTTFDCEALKLFQELDMEKLYKEALQDELNSQERSEKAQSGTDVDSTSIKASFDNLNTKLLEQQTLPDSAHSSQEN